MIEQTRRKFVYVCMWKKSKDTAQISTKSLGFFKPGRAHLKKTQSSSAWWMWFFSVKMLSKWVYELYDLTQKVLEQTARNFGQYDVFHIRYGPHQRQQKRQKKTFNFGRKLRPEKHRLGPFFVGEWLPGVFWKGNCRNRAGKINRLDTRMSQKPVFSHFLDKKSSRLSKCLFFLKTIGR